MKSKKDGTFQISTVSKVRFVMRLKDANGMANSEDPDQTDPVVLLFL